jgi:hypothetical protein
LASTINASNSGFGGIVSTGDSSGQLQLQTAATTAVTIDTSQRVGIGSTSFNTSTTKVQLGGQTGATTTPLAIAFSQDYTSNAASATSCKLFFYYNVSGSDVYGLGVGPNANNIYHAALSGSGKGAHQFYTNETLGLEVNAIQNVRMPSQPASLAYLTSNGDQTFSTGSALPFNISSLNRGGGTYSTSSYYYQVPTAGYYFIAAQCYGTSSGGASTMGLRIRVNGTEVWPIGGDVNIGNGSGQVSICGIQTSAMLNLSAGDRISIWGSAYNNSAIFRVYTGQSYFVVNFLG